MRKKNTIFILCLLILSVMISGCNKANEETRQTYNEFTVILKEKLEPISYISAVELPEETLNNGEISKEILLEDETLGDQCHLVIYCDQNEEIIRILMYAERGDFANLDFAVLSLYTYEAMGLPEIEAEKFYDQLGLLSREDDIDERIEVDGWDINVLGLPGYISFTMEPIN